jgi:hypothetical protein
MVLVILMRFSEIVGFRLDIACEYVLLLKYPGEEKDAGVRAVGLGLPSVHDAETLPTFVAPYDFCGESLPRWTRP